MPFGVIYKDRIHELEDEYIGLPEYAVTFNICNNKYINGKKWDSYTSDKQVNCLTRKLSSYAKDYGADIDYNRWVFEKCPKTQQMHVHCVIKCENEEDMCDMVSHINQVHKPLGKSADISYVTFMARRIFDEDGWVNYLNKDQNI